MCRMCTYTLLPYAHEDIITLENVGFISLVVTVATIFISFVTPYWLVYEDKNSSADKVNMGLLVNCQPVECDWLFEYGQIAEALPAWFKATQGLMTVGLALGLIALLIATLSLCCTCHSCNPHQPICGLLVIASVAMAVGIVIFGVKANQDWSIDLQWELLSIGRFGWSFWVADGAAALALLTSIMYCCMDRKRQ